MEHAILSHPAEVLRALDALSRIGELGYVAMESLALVPWFGRRGGRSFNSAVLRLLCPSSFGIIDWRNLAVLCCSPGFDGLVSPPVSFSTFSREDVVAARGHLRFTMDVYRSYNDTLRSLAAECGLRAADVDLVLWTYSIQCQPFHRFSLPIFSSTMVVGERERDSLRRDHEPVAARLVRAYLERLGDAGVLSKHQFLAELRSVFILIRDEVAAFGNHKRGRVRERVRLVVMAMDEAIASDRPDRLLGQWQKWQGMVDPTSPTYIGISLPTDMILDGYVGRETAMIAMMFLSPSQAGWGCEYLRLPVRFLLLSSVQGVFRWGKPGFTRRGLWFGVPRRVGSRTLLLDVRLRVLIQGKRRCRGRDVRLRPSGPPIPGQHWRTKRHGRSAILQWAAR